MRIVYIMMSRARKIGQINVSQGKKGCCDHILYLHLKIEQKIIYSVMDNISGPIHLYMHHLPNK